MIRTTDDGDLRVMTIDRPARRGTLRPTNLDTLEAAATGTDAPVVLLRGSGPTFCVGADLDSVTDLNDPEMFAKCGQHVTDAVKSAGSVAVAGIDRAAHDGGTELTLACDARVATPCATLGGPGVRLGLFGAQGGTIRPPRVADEGRALEFSLSGRVVNANEALRMGLVSRIVDDLGEVAVSMANNGHRSFRVVKERLRDHGNWGGRLEREVTGFAELHRANADDIAVSREK